VCYLGGIGWTIGISFTDSRMVPRWNFDGFDQYIRLFTTPRWITAYTNMFIYGAGVILGTLILGSLLAIALDSRTRFESVFRTMLLYPLSVSFIVTGLVWDAILTPSTGVESMVRGLGWSNFSFDWIGQQQTAVYCLIIAAVWHHVGLVMVIMLSGLRAFDPEIWKAAKVEGITTARTYLHVVLPSLGPTIMTCVILLAIQVIRSYDLVVALTGGGPGVSSDLPAKFVVDLAFERGNVGQASAAAVIMFATVLVCIIPYILIGTRRSEVE